MWEEGQGGYLEACGREVGRDLLVDLVHVFGFIVLVAAGEGGIGGDGHEAGVQVDVVQ